MDTLCRTLFALAVRSVTVFWLGYSLRGAEHLPRRGPAIVIANHNFENLRTQTLAGLADPQDGDDGYA